MPAVTEAAAPSTPSRWRRLIKPALTFAVFVLLVVGLHRLLVSFDYDEVVAGFDRVAPSTIALAGLLVAVGHGLYVVRERLAVDFAGEHRLGTREVAVASLIARSLSTLGLATVTGFALRLRLYEPHGLDRGRVARLTLYNEATFYVGVVASVALAFTAGGLPPMVATSVRLPSLTWLGPLAFALLAAYVVWGARRTRPLRIRSFELPPLGVVPLVAQLVLPCLDTLLAALITRLLLPAGTGLDFGAILAIGVVASIAGSVSQVPGGLGVYETTVLAFVPPAAHPDALAALLVRRAVVQLLPLAVGTVMLVGVALTGQRRRRPSRVALEFGRDAVALTVYIASVLSLIAAAVPRHNDLTARLGAVGQAVVFAGGLLTLVAARGLQQGRRRAWWVSVVTFALPALGALLSGHRPSLVVALGPLVVLLLARPLFPHPGPIFDGERTWWTAWLVTLFGIAWIADSHPDALGTEVRARTAGMLVAIALVLGALIARALPERRRRKRRGRARPPS